MSHLLALVIGHNVNEQLVSFTNDVSRVSKENLRFMDCEDVMWDKWSKNEPMSSYVFDRIMITRDMLQELNKNGKVNLNNVKFPWIPKVNAECVVFCEYKTIKGKDVNKREVVLIESLKEVGEVNSGIYNIVVKLLDGYDILVQDKFVTFEKFVESQTGIKDRDSEKGRYGVWTNPKGYIDTYKIGGRWDGWLLLKNGRRANIALNGDIDWDGMKKERLDGAISNWLSYCKITNKNSVGAQIFYNVFPDESKEQYLERTSKIYSHMIIDGKYIHISQNKNWYQEFELVMSEVKESEIITVVDCYSSSVALTHKEFQL
jgi:hypothetical protein